MCSIGQCTPHCTHRIRMTIKIASVGRVFVIFVVVVDFEDASNNIQIPCYGPFDIIKPSYTIVY
jgi:hypothetical protein